MTGVDMAPMEHDPGWRGTERVKLVNPERGNFEAFIYGNSLLADRVVEPESATGQTIVICGAGPSLADHAAQWTAKGDQVWGCNSALTYLVEHGHRVTHGFAIDQTPGMVETWYSTPDVEYLIASTVHPHLTQLLKDRGRRYAFFHNYVGLGGVVEYCECGHDKDQHEGPCKHCEDCGEYRPRAMEYEDWLYYNLYPGTIRAGSGLNSVTRAIDVAFFMGAAHVVVLGADCAIRFRQPQPPGSNPGTPAHRRWLEEHTQMHADGAHALAYGATEMVFTGVIDGRTWLTKPDLAISAVWLERWRRKLEAARQETGTGPKLTIIGDTLVKALRGKEDTFLDRLPALTDGKGKVLRLI